MRRVFGFATVRLLSIFVLAGLLPALAAPQDTRAVTPQDLMSQLKWRSVGPYIGGRVVTVAGVPGNANLFYAGAVGGGVWKSSDEGIKWENITDKKLPGPSSSIGAIAVAPSDPSTIYVGTGEDDIRNDMIPGDGIYKSTDAGKTWQYAGLRETQSISEIVVSPQDPNVVYASSMGHVFVAGADRGVFKSTDGGKSWKKILFVDDKTGAIDLVMDPNHPDVLYATMWQAQRMPWGLISGGPGSGLYKTTDGGEHWTNLTHNPGLPQGILGRIGVCAGGQRSRTRCMRLFRRRRAGCSAPTTPARRGSMVNNEMKLRQRAFYYMAIYADPKDANTVYAPQVDCAVGFARRGQDLHQAAHAARRQSRAVDQSERHEDSARRQRRRRHRLDRRRQDVELDHNQPTGQFYHVNLDDQFPYHIYGAQQDEGSFEGPSADPTASIPVGDWKTRGVRRKHVHRAAAGQSQHHLRQRLLQHLRQVGRAHRPAAKRQPVAALSQRRFVRGAQVPLRVDASHPVLAGQSEGDAHLRADMCSRATTTA